MSPRSLRVLLLALVLGFAFVAPVPMSALDNGVARTPPMGWNSWNKFGCNVSEDLISRWPTRMASAA